MLLNAQALAALALPRSADTDSSDFWAQNETLKLVACPICRAVYLLAAPQQATAQMSFADLEEAFLRVCHFCFRCQQPACPQCWNPIHHVCTACGEEAHLPFLSPVPSLEGLAFAPPVFPQLAQAADLPFICLRNGCFSLAQPPHSEQQPVEMSPCSEQMLVTGATMPADPATSPQMLQVQTGPITTRAHSPYPSWLQEIMGRHQRGQNDASIDQAQMVDEQECGEFWLPPDEQVQRVAEAPWPAWWQELSLPPQQAGRFSQAGTFSNETNTHIEVMTPPEIRLPKGTTLAEWIEDAQRNIPHRVNVVEWIEDGLIVVMSLILLALILMISLAVKSASMNTLFLQLLHVDIRAEIAYLFQSI